MSGHPAARPGSRTPTLTPPSSPGPGAQLPCSRPFKGTHWPRACQDHPGAPPPGLSPENPCPGQARPPRPAFTPAVRRGFAGRRAPSRAHCPITYRLSDHVGRAPPCGVPRSPSSWVPGNGWSRTLCDRAGPRVSQGEQWSGGPGAAQLSRSLPAPLALADFDEPKRSTFVMFGVLTIAVRIYHDRWGYGVYSGPIGTAVLIIAAKWVRTVRPSADGPFLDCLLSPPPPWAGGLGTALAKTQNMALRCPGHTGPVCIVSVTH